MKRPDHFDDNDWAIAQEWYASRPKAVQVAIERCPPWLLYRLKETGQIGNIYCFTDRMDGVITCKFDCLDIHGNQIRVFGVSLDSLEVVSEERSIH